MAEKLDLGERFPELLLTCTDGSGRRLPDDLTGAYNIVLFYRGHW